MMFSKRSYGSPFLFFRLLNCAQYRRNTAGVLLQTRLTCDAVQQDGDAGVTRYQLLLQSQLSARPCSRRLHSTTFGYPYITPFTVSPAHSQQVPPPQLLSVTSQYLIIWAR